MTLGSTFTLCAWYNPDVTSGDYPRIVHLSNGAGSDRIEMRKHVSSNNLAVEVYNGNTNIMTSTGIYVNRFQYAVWQHACFTMSGTSGTVYYNGVAESAAVTLSTAKTTVAMGVNYVGTNPYGNNLYRGYVDEIRVYSRALSAAEITSIYEYRGIVIPLHP